MFKFIQAIGITTRWLGFLFGAIVGIEAARTNTALTGPQKRTEVLKALRDAILSATGNRIPDSVLDAIGSIVDGIVSILNGVGVFKRSDTFTEPEKVGARVVADEKDPELTAFKAKFPPVAKE
jgi:hypothetical protein